MENKMETKKVESKEAQIKPFTKKDQVAPKGKKETKPIAATPTLASKPEVKPVVTVEPPAPTIQVVEVKPVEKVVSEQPTPLTLESLAKAIQLLRQDFDGQTLKIEEILTLMAKKRKPATNGNHRVQVKDNETGAVYPSKNAVYQSMLKAGSLDALVKDGVFGSDPLHNTFGVYALFRAYPGRFVEVQPDMPEQKS